MGIVPQKDHKSRGKQLHAKERRRGISSGMTVTSKSKGKVRLPVEKWERMPTGGTAPRGKGEVKGTKEVQDLWEIPKERETQNPANGEVRNFPWEMRGRGGGGSVMGKPRLIFRRGTNRRNPMPVGGGRCTPRNPERRSQNHGTKLIGGRLPGGRATATQVTGKPIRGGQSGLTLALRITSELRMEGKGQRKR